MTKWTTKHKFEWDGRENEFRGLQLCTCGLPENSPLHTRRDRKKIIKKMVGIIEANNKIMNDLHSNQQFSTIREKVEKMKVKFVENNFYGSEKDLDRKIEFETAYNQALQDVLEVLSKMRGESGLRKQ